MIHAFGRKIKSIPAGHSDRIKTLGGDAPMAPPRSGSAEAAAGGNGVVEHDEMQFLLALDLAHGAQQHTL